MLWGDIDLTELCYWSESLPITYSRDHVIIQYNNTGLVAGQTIATKQTCFLPSWSTRSSKRQRHVIGIKRRLWFDGGNHIKSVWEFTACHLTQTKLFRKGLSGQVLSKLGPNRWIVIVWPRKGEENNKQHIQKPVIEGEFGSFKDLEKTASWLDCKVWREAKVRDKRVVLGQVINIIFTHLVWTFLY